MLPEQHVAAVLSVYVCLLGRERASERREGCRYRWTEGAKEESVNKGGGGLQNEGMHDRKQTKTLGGREREGDTAGGETEGREGEKVQRGGGEEPAVLQRRLSHPFLPTWFWLGRDANSQVLLTQVRTVSGEQRDGR